MFSTNTTAPSIRSLLQQNDGKIRILEAHDNESNNIVRRASSRDGNYFHGVWMSGLTQSTFLGLPDTELISPLERAHTLLAVDNDQSSVGERSLCAAFDADSGGRLEDIPSLVSILHSKGVSMIIIEDKSIGLPGTKVNSLSDSSGSQALADKYEFAKVIRAFRDAAEDTDMMITARIESFTVRQKQSSAAAEEASLLQSLQDALQRANVYCDAGADAIMIHSKSKQPQEVFSFIHRFKHVQPDTPVVLVPTTYADTREEEMYAAGANVIIYANHLMRAKLRAIHDVARYAFPTLHGRNQVVDACLKAQNYGCLLRVLQSHYFGMEAAKRAYIARESAASNMSAATSMLLEGRTAGAADSCLLPVKKLLQINGQQVVDIDPFVLRRSSTSEVDTTEWRPTAQL